MNERTIRDAWARFVGDGEIPSSIRSAVAGSWQRSKSFDVDITSQGAPIVSEAELYRRRADNALLAASARPAMERAAGILSDASSMLVLTDGSGHIIQSVGDHRTIDAGREIHLEDGGCWSEDKIGTNAIGTAMAARQPVQIHATEHFCEKVQRWTCAAAPIFHPLDHELLGIIDISGPPQTFSSQNLALVVSIAGHMEALISQRIKHQHARLLSCFHEKQRKWASHELVAIDRRGGIVQSSPDALRRLAQLFGGSSKSQDLSYLRSLRFEDWPEDLIKHVTGARTVLIKDGEEELGAIIVLPTSSYVLPKKVIGKKRPLEIMPSGATVPYSLPEVPASAIGVGAPPTSLEGTIRDGQILKTQAKDEAGKEVQTFVASDPVVKQICKNIAAAARLKVPILICGQTGTGKEELARFAHQCSGRKGAFIPVNCSALPDSLIEAELFGYADGSFTGARKGGSPGLAKEAHGGTLFLDEIGEMPIMLQSVLLRFLDDFMVRPVGGVASKVDVLLVSATNVDLGLAVTSRKFRADLLYRLNTIHVTLPSLAERTDFNEIVLFLLNKLNPAITITSKALAELSRAAWHGNIRELRGILARLSLAACERSGQIDDMLVSSLALPHGQMSGTSGGSLREMQRARLLAVYAETGGNISETARRLNVCRNTVYRALENPED